MNDQSRRTEQSDPRVEAALRDYLERVDRGEPVDREEFLAQHAPIADQLRSFIAAEDEVRKLAAAGRPLERAQDSTKSFVGQGQETIAPHSDSKRVIEPGGSKLSGQFGRYSIIRALGKGAMGTVYLARDTHIERQVALKTPHFTEDPTGEQIQRFFREARAAGNLRHPHICPIYDFGQIDGKHYISMAYIEGRPLSAFIQPDKPQTERQILIVIRKLALALQEAHDHGVVHRDLKPANIMVDRKGEPIIMDFGLARQTQPGEDIRLTQTGNIIGTPAYMSPEQVEGEPDKIGPASDQYSLGVILYELLTAHLPFRGSVIAVLRQILTEKVSPPSQWRPDVDPRIEAVCLKMMTKASSDRFASLKAVADELAANLKNPAAKPKPEDAGGKAARATASPAGPSSADVLRADAAASRSLKSLKQQVLAESDLASLEELARKCLARHDDEQVIQIIERIPQEQRNAGLAGLLKNARARVDEIAFLICDIDEAERVNDAEAALKKAEALLKLKPGHQRALKIREKYSGPGAGRAARVGVMDQFRRPLNDGGWIPWSVLASGLVFLGVVACVVVIFLNKTAVEIDIQNPGVEVAVKGTSLIVTGPNQQSVKVTPGDQQLTISCAGLETVTKSFTINKGEKRTVAVSIVDSKLVASLDNEIRTLTPAQEQQAASPTSSAVKPSLLQNPARQGTELPKGEQEQAAIRILRGHTAPVKHLLFTPDGSRIVSASNSNHDELRGGTNFNEPGNDNTVRVWHVGSGKQIRKFFVKEGIGYGPQGIALSPDGRLLAACSSWDWGRSYTQPRVFVWDIASATRKYHFALPGDRAMRAVGFSLDGATLYAVRDGRGLHSWSMRDGRESGTIELEKQNPAATPFATTFTSGCRYVLGGLWKGGVRLWDRETGMEVRTFEGHTKVPAAVAMSPDGTRILSSAGDFSVRIWETESGRQVFCMDNLDSIVSSVVFSPDGKYFMTGAEDGMVRVFEIATQKERARFSGHTAKVNCVAFSPDGHLAASSSDDTTIRLWQLPQE